MSDISNGPVSSRPNSRHKVPDGATCDNAYELHQEERPAVVRRQGETDSFGCEYEDLCQECDDRMQAEVEAERSAPKYCDWCKDVKSNVRPQRDFDEGLAGRLYDVCQGCRDRERARLAEDQETFDELDDPDFY